MKFGMLFELFLWRKKLGKMKCEKKLGAIASHCPSKRSKKMHNRKFIVDIKHFSF
jgi:hypothetical protein